MFLSHKQRNHRNINDLFTVKDSMHFLFHLLDLFDPTKFAIFVFLRDVIDSQENINTSNETLCKRNIWLMKS